MADDELNLMRRQVEAHESITKSLARIAVLMEYPPERHFDGQPYRRVATQ